MNTRSQKTVGDYLREYSVLVDSWWPEAGDTHEILGAREVLHDSLNELDAEGLVMLRQADARAEELALRHVSNNGWDARMLRDVVRLIESERAAA